MAVYKLARFSKPEVLRRMRPELLIDFLQRHKEHLKNRGIDPEPAAGIDFDALVKVFMSPDVDYPDLANELYLVDEMSTTEGMDTLLTEYRRQRTKLVSQRDSSPADVAVEAFLLDPSLVERKHAESYITRVRAFEHSLAVASPPPRFEAPSDDTVAALERDLDDWFENNNRGRGCRVFVFPQQRQVWFLVHRGEPLTRHGTLANGEPSAVVFRPEKYDVLFYRPSSGELAINARPKSVKDLYREQFGKHLFGDPALFLSNGRYTLEPLREGGRQALTCADLDGMDWVRLREIWFWRGGEAREIEIRKADDVFEAFEEQGRSLPARLPISRAKFEVKFSDAERSRMVTIRPPGDLQYTRDSDSAVLEQWLLRRGFLTQASRTEDAAA